MQAARSSATYQIVLVAILCLNFGVLFFDRNAINFLMPFIQPELGLSYTQVGLLGAGLSFTWAVAAIFVGWLSDKIARRKIIIVTAGLVFSVCSVVSGLASSFLMLFAARLLMGLSEGGVMPISHAMVSAEVSPNRRALAMGVTQNVGSSLLGSTVAPWVLVPVALAWGWRHAFFLAAVPGLICALLVVLFVIERPIQKAPSRAVGEPLPLLETLMNRNVIACSIMAVLLVSYLVITWSFMPLVLTQFRGIDKQTMSNLMAVLGFSSFLASFGVTTLSDYIGRRPVMIVMPFIGVVLPLAALYYDGSAWVMGGLFFIGWLFNGIFPMFMATVPSESVSPRQVATAMGIVMGIGEILGGVFGPSLAGRLSDLYGLSAPCWFLAAVAVLGGITALFLKETAPRIVGEKADPELATAFE